MHKYTNRVAIVLLALIAAVTSGGAIAREQEIPLSEVPPAVAKAAMKAVPNIHLTEAEVSKKKGRIRYELEGRAQGKTYEIHISEDGKVLDIGLDD